MSREPNWLAHMPTGIHYQPAINKGGEHNPDGPVWHVRPMHGWAQIGGKDLYREEAVVLAMTHNRARDAEVAIEVNRRRENGYDPRVPFSGPIVVRRPDLSAWEEVIRR